MSHWPSLPGMCLGSGWEITSGTVQVRLADLSRLGVRMCVWVQRELSALDSPLASSPGQSAKRLILLGLLPPSVRVWL